MHKILAAVIYISSEIIFFLLSSLSLPSPSLPPLSPLPLSPLSRNDTTSKLRKEVRERYEYLSSKRRGWKLLIGTSNAINLNKTINIFSYYFLCFFLFLLVPFVPSCSSCFFCFLLFPFVFLLFFYIPEIRPRNNIPVICTEELQ